MDIKVGALSEVIESACEFYLLPTYEPDMEKYQLLYTS